MEPSTTCRSPAHKKRRTGSDSSSIQNPTSQSSTSDSRNIMEPPVPKLGVIRVQLGEYVGLKESWERHIRDVEDCNRRHASSRRKRDQGEDLIDELDNTRKGFFSLVRICQGFLRDEWTPLDEAVVVDEVVTKDLTYIYRRWASCVLKNTAELMRNGDWYRYTSVLAPQMIERYTMARAKLNKMLEARKEVKVEKARREAWAPDDERWEEEMQDFFAKAELDLGNAGREYINDQGHRQLEL